VGARVTSRPPMPTMPPARFRRFFRGAAVRLRSEIRFGYAPRAYRAAARCLQKPEFDAARPLGASVLASRLARMTLVLTALTQHEVIQVSDRRFTYKQGDLVLRRDDENNKAILFCGRLMFAFTGFGDLGMERQTALWLASRICDVIAEADQSGDHGTVLEGVRAKATELFRKLRYRGHRHAFVGAGWERFSPEQPDAPASPDEMQPYMALISNFHDGERERPTVSTKFSLYLTVCARGHSAPGTGSLGGPLLHGIKGCLGGECDVGFGGRCCRPG
jgi:hypothetical protein